MGAYAELHCHSYFSFLDGVSSPEELALEAAGMGLAALALTDHDGLYGVMRFKAAAEEAGIRPIYGAEVTCADGSHLTLLARTDQGYANLSRLLSYAHQGQAKGEALLETRLLAEYATGLIGLSGCPLGAVAKLVAAEAVDEAVALAARMAEWFEPGWFYIELQRHYGPADRVMNARLAEVAQRAGLEIVATGNVHYAYPEQANLQQVMTCIRYNTTLMEAGDLLRPNHEAYLCGAEEMARRFPEYPEAIAATVKIAAACDVTLDFRAVGVPDFSLPEGETGEGYLRRLCQQALPWRYPGEALRQRAIQQMEHELDVISQTGLCEYFLTVYDIMTFAREQGIRAQGRGSAANSIVAYLLQITAIEPLEQNLLFERFISVERQSLTHTMPDIDLDFDRERREEVIQYVYNRFGWENTAMVCTLVSFRSRSALRDVGRALGFAPEVLDRAAKAVSLHGSFDDQNEMLRETLGEDIDAQRWQHLLVLSQALYGVPRHLGIHVGGMVVTRCPLIQVVPIEPATMEGRVVVQWDKDSVEDAGLIKIDILSLGMLAAIDKAFALIEEQTGYPPTFQSIGLSDPKVYDLIASGDTVGVFQVESRAQMQMLPRLKPACFDDLVIEVALVRPGPLQGGMVHPYLRRRRGEEPVRYAHPKMERALKDTLGIIVFQEQVLMVAMDVAGFSAGESELLRRAMGRKRSHEEMERLRQRFVDGAMANGVSEEQAHHTFDQLGAFAGFGFNRAHAASFALLGYVSAWLKCYHPAPFFVGLLNSQPMGFYAPGVVVEDAKRHGLQLLPVDINRSQADCSLEEGAIRLGLNYVHGIGDELQEAIVSARGEGFGSLEDLCRRVTIGQQVLEHLIMSGACDGWGERRRDLLWRMRRSGIAPLIDDLPKVSLPVPGEGERLAIEYAITGVSSDKSPVALFRRVLREAGVMTSSALSGAHSGAFVRVGGQVIIRQRPPTAKGIMFITLDDEEGHMNLVIMPDVLDRFRMVVRSPGLLAEGNVERDHGVINIMVKRLWSLWPDTEGAIPL